MAQAAGALLSEALQKIDLTEHVATHPRLGVVDHISFHPLENCSLQELGAFVNSFGSQISDENQLPVLLYGSAEDNRKTLAEVRRSTGYFKEGLAVDSSVEADFGPSAVDPHRGILCLGWVCFF